LASAESIEPELGGRDRTKTEWNTGRRAYLRAPIFDPDGAISDLARFLGSGNPAAEEST
jgi:hypothetical protein